MIDCYYCSNVYMGGLGKFHNSTETRNYFSRQTKDIYMNEKLKHTEFGTMNQLFTFI